MLARPPLHDWAAPRAPALLRAFDERRRATLNSTLNQPCPTAAWHFSSRAGRRRRSSCPCSRRPRTSLSSKAVTESWLPRALGSDAWLPWSIVSYGYFSVFGANRAARPRDGYAGLPRQVPRGVRAACAARSRTAAAQLTARVCAPYKVCSSPTRRRTVFPRARLPLGLPAGALDAFENADLAPRPALKFQVCERVGTAPGAPWGLTGRRRRPRAKADVAYLVGPAGPARPVDYV